MNDDTRIRDNLVQIRSRIAEAAQRSGRTAADIKLVAVTKYVDAELASLLVNAGCLDLGEARPQELWRKADALAGQQIDWHLIGHLQRNKLARTLPIVRLIHSGDSLRLIQAIVAEASAAGLPATPTLLEVNVSGDATKHGFRPDELPSLGEQLGRLDRVAVRGLMCMAGREGNLDDARRNFEQLRLLRDRLRSTWPSRLSLDELSMGMSGDFEVAIEVGATIVRIGSLLFEGVTGEREA
jgi:pyridoxal phosphate enzyme (YggS family)